MLTPRLGRKTAPIRQRGQDGGKALDGVHQPHEALVEPAAEVAGQHAERDSRCPMPMPTAITPTMIELTAPVMMRESRSRPN
jgi:hypothetical protein